MVEVHVAACTRNLLRINLLQALLREAALLVLLVLVPLQVEANGKGPIGIYAISRRYVLTADSNIDALLVVDLYKGGTVGSLVLHDPELDVRPLHDHSNKTKTYIGGKDKSVAKGWVDPTGIASCDTCRYIYLTSTHGHNFYQIELELTLQQMAQENDFAALSRGVLLPVWPWNVNTTGVGEPTSSVRMLEVHRSGSVGYMAHRTYGLLRFFLNDGGRILGSSADVYIGIEELGTPDGVVAGLTLAGDNEDLLLVTASRSTLVVGVNRTGHDKGVLQQVIDLQGHCNGELGNNMWFRDAAIVKDGPDTYLYTVGLFTPGQDDRGMSLYHLKQRDDGQWTECINVAGPQKDRGGWRDGYGEDARFTRPHEFTLLPRQNTELNSPSDSNELSGDVLVLSDCDNRALRAVELTPRKVHHVSTIQYYDQNQWWPNEENGEEALPEDIIFTFNSATSLTYNETKDWCNENAGGGDVCSLAGIRDGLVALNTTWNETTVWTANSCFGCWLRFPGVCDATMGGWDADRRMVATLYGNGRIRTDCTRLDVSVTVTPLCCGRIQSNVPRPGTVWISVAAGASAFFLGICFLFIHCCKGTREAAYNTLEQLT
mmetsp:Transcript_13568/g.29466  ORF Transcript_13568/g.29466 Transcript_13568/m.29466 type:complete len:602 (-) Transcript_13568:2939-4744(-)